MMMMLICWQMWTHYENSMLKLSRMLCLDYEDSVSQERLSGSVRLRKCHYSGGSQQWKWMTTRHQVTTTMSETTTTTTTTCVLFCIMLRQLWILCNHTFLTFCSSCEVTCRFCLFYYLFLKFYLLSSMYLFIVLIIHVAHNKMEYNNSNTTNNNTESIMVELQTAQ